MKRFEDYLDPRPSTIANAGTGLFTLKKFKKGELIGLMYGRPAAHDDTYVLWVEGQGIEIENNLKYINHSKEYNCELYGVMVYATRDILEGEELFWDYDSETENVF